MSGKMRHGRENRSIVLYLAGIEAFQASCCPQANCMESGHDPLELIPHRIENPRTAAHGIDVVVEGFQIIRTSIRFRIVDI